MAREPRGTVSMLRCRYHSWTYNLEGELTGVPEGRDFVGLDKSCRSLVSVRCEIWGGWIFVNRDPDAPPLLEWLAPVPDEIADFEVAGRPQFWKSMLPIFDVVLREDTENLPWIQKSVESPAFRGVPLSYQERRIYHLHEEIDRVIGTDRIPQALRVEPRLASYVEGSQ